MPARDIFHDAVIHALEREKWKITHDPYLIYYELGKMYIDLGAEKVLAAEKENQKIAVEIKSFIQTAAVSEFHTALGQFINYRTILQESEPERILYLAIPDDTYNSLFQTRFVQKIMKHYQLKLIIYKPTEEVIKKWIN